MQHTFSLVGGASLGAGLMFLLDPDRGRRRRALRDKGVRLSRKTRELAGSASRDVQNRALGMRAAVKSWVQSEPPVSDHVLAQRIRAKLGLYARHPSAIEVHVTDGGVVTLSGPVLEDEVDDICSAIQRMRGVSQIFNRMDRHASSQNVPVLQGAIGPKRGQRFAFMHTHWSPTTRMVAALIGTAALLYRLSRRTVGATTLAASGLGLLLRSATNQEFARLLGWHEEWEMA